MGLVKFDKFDRMLVCMSQTPKKGKDLALWAYRRTPW
jgi:hypothetical protein